MRAKEYCGVSELLISEAFELYRIQFIVYRNQSSKTEEMSRLACRSLVKFLGDINICDLTFEDVRKWKANLEYSRSQNTARGYLIKLRTVLKHLKLQGYNVLEPELVALPKRIQAPVDYLTAEEVQELISCIFKPSGGYKTLNRYRNRAMIAILYASGIRVSELCALNKLSIRQDNTFTITGKGGKTRLCFIDDRAALYVKEYLALRHDRNPALFTSHNGDRITKSVVQLVFRCATEKMGYPKPIHPHMLRHSFATNLLENNTNLYYVSKFLGHSSVQTTEMYLHYKDPDLKKLYTEKHSI